MLTLPAELLYTARTLAESQLAGYNALMRTAFESGVSLIDANLHATRAHLDAANAASSELLFVRAPQDLLTLTASHSQQAIDRAGRYGRRMAGVASALQDRLSELSNDHAGRQTRNSLE